nr:MAG TPA: hypothetical protein [Caudoviricetes sp.]
MKKMLLAFSLLAVSDHIPNWKLKLSAPAMPQKRGAHRFSGVAANRRKQRKKGK